MWRSEGIEDKTRLDVKKLRWKCDPEKLGFETTADFACCHEIFGQDRALNAIRLGLEIESPGYNIYVSGLTGTGKTTAIKQLLQNMKSDRPSSATSATYRIFRMAIARFAFSCRPARATACAAAWRKCSSTCANTSRRRSKATPTPNRKKRCWRSSRASAPRWRNSSKPSSQSADFACWRCSTVPSRDRSSCRSLTASPWTWRSCAACSKPAR